MSSRDPGTDFLFFLFRMAGRLIGMAIRATFDLIVYVIMREIHHRRSQPKNEGEMEIPLPYRFEHTHIVGGTGHGKTQLLQAMILKDLEYVEKGQRSLIVIDSQGDMINNISHLGVMEAISDRLILIDPKDTKFPPALNLFDFGQDRIGRYNEVQQEALLNGAIELYEYLFGALLGAEQTPRQRMIFHYLSRLLIEIPGANIFTLLEFMNEPEKVRPYLSRLSRIDQHFFEKEYLTSKYDSNREQNIARLWMILQNRILERMFNNEKNKVNLFEAINRGSLVLINTSKEFLKPTGSAILGRFFIALIYQAALERAALERENRKPTFVYIDEAQDYFDDVMMSRLFTQARKYNVGMVIAHQNLGQLSRSLGDTVMGNTAIKFVGGLSSDDAAEFAREMQCEKELLLSVRKHQKHTEFNFMIKNYREGVGRLDVGFGLMEEEPRLTEEQYKALINANRRRYCELTPREIRTTDAFTKQPAAELDIL